MIVEFFKRGTGLASGSIDYFLGKNRDRDGARLLSGNLEEVAELIDSSPYTKKYTAGCLSFYEDDLEDADKQRIMADFEKALFPGLTPDQYRIVWIEHRDKKNTETGKKRLELNFLIPNVEITTGKRLQPFFAKADLQRIDDFKTITNYRYRLFDPDDPLNKRSVKVAKNLPKDKKEFINAIHQEVTFAVVEGLVRDRNSLKQWMTNIGLEITKSTKKQISVKNPNNLDGQPIVLRGEFYEQDFRYSEQSAELKRAASERYRQEAERRFNNCSKRFKELCAAKGEYHLQRYTATNRPSARSTTAELTARKEAGSDVYPTSYEERNPTNTTGRKTVIPRDRAEEDRYSVFYGADGAGLEQTNTRRTSELTGSNTEYEKGISELKRIKPNDRAASDVEEDTNFNEYSLSFNSTYSAYSEHLLWLDEHKKKYRNRENGTASDLSETERRKAESLDLRLHRAEAMCTSGQKLSDLQRRLYDGEGSEINDSTSAVIEHHRRTTAAIEAAAENAAGVIGNHQITIHGYRRIKELHEDFTAETQRSGQDRWSISENYATTVRADYFSSFFRRTTEELRFTSSKTIEGFSDDFGSRRRSEKSHSERIAEVSHSRDRQADGSISSGNEREVGLSKQLSRKIRGFNTEDLFKALDELDKRKRLERDYDSPSPF